MFRFTIRELILCTLIVALATGWWLDRWQLRRDQISRHTDVIQRTMSAAQQLAKEKGEDIVIEGKGISISAKVDGSANVTLGNQP
jgi:hypothetical protein